MLAVADAADWARAPLRLTACAVLLLEDEAAGRATLQQVCVPEECAGQGREEEVLAAAVAAAAGEAQQVLDVFVGVGRSAGA